LPSERNPSASNRIALWRSLFAAAVIAAFAGGLMLSGLVTDSQTGDAAALRFAPFTTDPGYQGFPAWSPDGQTIAYAATANGTLQIFARRLSSPVSAQITQAAYDCRYPFWSADGKRIYYVSLARDRESIWSVGAAGGTPQIVIENASRGAMTP